MKCRSLSYLMARCSDLAAAAAREELLSQRTSAVEEVAAHASATAATLREEASRLGAANGQLHADCETLQGRLAEVVPAYAACQAQLQAFQEGLDQCETMLQQSADVSRRASLAGPAMLNGASMVSEPAANGSLQLEQQRAMLTQRRPSAMPRDPRTAMAAVRAQLQAYAKAAEAAERRERIAQQRLAAEGQLRSSLSAELLQVKGERAAAARQRAELQAKVDRQQGQLSEARALQATTAAALSRVDWQMAQKASQLEDANAAIAELRADGRAAEAKMEALRQECGQLQEHVLQLQQDIVSSQRRAEEEVEQRQQVQAALQTAQQQLQDRQEAVAEAARHAADAAAQHAIAQADVLQQLQGALEQQQASKEEVAGLHTHAAALHSQVEDLTAEVDHLAARAAAGDAAKRRLAIAHFLLDGVTAGPDRLRAQELREAVGSLGAELGEMRREATGAAAARDNLAAQLHAATAAMAEQAEDLAEAREEARRLGDTQVALQGAFVQLQTEVDCLRARPTARHNWEAAAAHPQAPGTPDTDAGGATAPGTPLLSRKMPAHSGDSLVMDIKRPVMHIRQTIDKRTTGSTRASRMGGYMSTADSEDGWPLHPHTAQILALQAEADAARQELEMARMASASAAAMFQEHSDDLRARLDAAERQLSGIQQDFAVLQAAADAAAAEHAAREAQHAAQLAAAVARSAALQEELRRSETCQSALEDVAREGLVLGGTQDEVRAGDARQSPEAIQRETMWLRAKICILAQSCKALRQRLQAFESQQTALGGSEG